MGGKIMFTAELIVLIYGSWLICGQGNPFYCCDGDYPSEIR
jgi:hypothetical protein